MPAVTAALLLFLLVSAGFVAGAGHAAAGARLVPLKHGTTHGHGNGNGNGNGNQDGNSNGNGNGTRQAVRSDGNGNGNGNGNQDGNSNGNGKASGKANGKTKRYGVAPSRGHVVATTPQHASTLDTRPAAPAPTIVVPKPSPSAASQPAPATSNWHRDARDREDRSVTAALASGLGVAGRSAGFPLLLLALTVAFLLVQHRLDGRDSKLAAADWASDQGLEFRPPVRLDG